MFLDSCISNSPTLQFSLTAQDLRNAGRNIISLGLGEPEFDTPQHIKDAAIDALHCGLTRYSSAPGLLELRQLVSDKLRGDNGIAADPSEIIITPGAKNALFIACAAVLRPGDEVLNISPCYVSNEPILKLAEPQAFVHHVPLRITDFSLDHDRILSLLNDRTRLIFINYPNNPTGKMLDVSDANFLRQIIAQHNIYLLSDEIYESLRLTDKPHISLSSFSDIRHKVITINGFSKSYSMTGWRIGYSHACKELTNVMLRIHQQINTNTAVFIQKGAVAALKGPQDHLAVFLRNLQLRAQIFLNFANEHDGLRSSAIEGGFFGFLFIGSTGLDSDTFCARLLQESGVAVIPGISFGRDFNYWVRVSFAAQTEDLIEGLARIGAFVNILMKSK